MDLEKFVDLHFHEGKSFRASPGISYPELDCFPFCIAVSRAAYTH